MGRRSALWGCTGFDWTRFDWAGLDWTGMNRTRCGCIVALCAALVGCGDESMMAAMDEGDSGSLRGGSNASGSSGARQSGSGSNENGSNGDGSTSAMNDGGARDASEPPAPGQMHEERNGIVDIEAEDFTNNDEQGTPRTWVVFRDGNAPRVNPDPDPPHFDGASGGAYLEGLPDTRVTHDDQLTRGTNFFGGGGQGPVLTYEVRFSTPGRYFVWARALSTGTEDNGIHVGIDGTWPSSGERMQWCGSRGKWAWSNAQRDSAGPCGRDGTITIEVPSAGVHDVMFSMREDGFEFDRFVLAQDPAYRP